DEYVYSTNTVSNSVTVLSNKDGSVKAIVAGVGKAPHAAQPNPKSPDRIYVSNIGPQATGADGKPDRGETITELVRADGKWEAKTILPRTAAGLPRRPRATKCMSRPGISRRHGYMCLMWLASPSSSPPTTCQSLDRTRMALPLIESATRCGLRTV